MPAATGGTAVNVELGRVAVTGATGVVKELGVYEGTVPIVGKVDGVGVDRLGKPLDKLKEGEPIVGMAVGTAPPGTEVVACGKVGVNVAVTGVGVANGT